MVDTYIDSELSKKQEEKLFIVHVLCCFCVDKVLKILTASIRVTAIQPISYHALLSVSLLELAVPPVQ